MSATSTVRQLLRKPGSELNQSVFPGKLGDSQVTPEVELCPSASLTLRRQIGEDGPQGPASSWAPHRSV